MTKCPLLAAVAVLAAADPAGAAVITAVEPNDTFATAQVIPAAAFTSEANPNIGVGAGGGFFNTSTLIPHATITRSATGAVGLDYFRFTTFATGLVILDIDNGPTGTNFDTEIFLFNAAGGLLAQNDDNGLDPGDSAGAVGGANNSRIQILLPAGTYTVGVAGQNSFAGAGPGTILGAPIPANGTYTLHISASAAVPEPASATLLAAGGLGLVGRRIVRRKAA